MAFDLSTAQPVTAGGNTGDGGFDLSTAKSVNQPQAAADTPMLTGALAKLAQIAGIDPQGSTHPVAALERAAHFASGAVGGLGGGLTYLGTLAASGGDAEAAKAVQEATQKALTYTPRTDEGKALSEAADQALGKIPQALDTAGRVTADKTGSPLLGAAVNTGGNAALQLLGLRGILKGGAAPAAGVAGAADEAAASVPRATPTTPAELLQQSLDNGRQVGYQTTPNYNPQATFLDKLGQGIAGKTQTEQLARVQNQGVTNALAARAVEQPPASLVTQQVLQQIRQAAVDKGYAPIKDLPGPIPVDGQFLRNNLAIKSAHGDELSGNPDVAATADILLNPNKARSPSSGSVSTRTVPDKGDSLIPQSDDFLGSLGNGVAKLPNKPLTIGPSGGGGTIDPLTLSRKVPSFDPSTALDYISTLRSRAQDAFAAGRPSAGSAFKQQANELEALIDRHLQNSDDVSSGLLNNYRAARQLIAKTFAVGDALNPSTGNVNAIGIGKALKDGTPLTGDLKTIADFANSAPGITSVPQGTALPTSPFNTLAGAAAAHGTGGASLALIPAARAFAAKWLLEHNDNPALLQPGKRRTYGQTAIDAIHGNATAFTKMYGGAGSTALLSVPPNVPEE